MKIFRPGVATQRATRTEKQASATRGGDDLAGSRRERRYKAIIMDPPTFGRGSTGEMWKIEDHMWTLLTKCREILSEKPLFFLINASTARLSPTVVANLLAEPVARPRRPDHCRRGRSAGAARWQGAALRHLRSQGSVDGLTLP